MFHKRKKREQKRSMIKSLFRTSIVNFAALYFFSQYVPGFHLNEGLKTLLIISLTFSILHTLLRPLFDLLLGGVNFLTFGIIGIVFDALILFALTLYFPQITLTPWHFSGLIVHGFQIPAYDFNQYTTIGLVALLINILQIFVHLLV